LRVAVDFYPRVRFADAVQKRAHLRNLTKAAFNEFLPGKKNSKTKVAILTSDKIGKTYMHTLCGKRRCGRYRDDGANRLTLRCRYGITDM